jgi:hypothetical protein
MSNEPPEVKFFTNEWGRFVGARYERATNGYSYSYYTMTTDGQLGERRATNEFVSKLLDVRKPKEPPESNYLAKFYDGVWDDSIDKNSDVVVRERQNQGRH